MKKYKTKLVFQKVVVVRSSNVRSFVRSFVCLFVRLFVRCSFVRSFVRLFVRSLFVRSFVVRSFVRWLSFVVTEERRRRLWCSEFDVRSSMCGGR